ncbi:molybdopterin-binding protein [Desulfobacula sp.]|uniref:molybdopterin-binding protein n=1 Tax=Desulfobacula sp. TaxID=2593537 RepID=UPI0025BC54D2|nr:molybdopterin-binding protein [Desulfobacula sp.]MBC2703449.1 molybdopterin-binding protein [Desulfobacula sp.]
MKKLKVEDAVGTVLAHDMTRIIRGKFKGVGFKKGYVIQKKDIPELLKIGKQYLYVLDLGNDQLHEDDAAKRIASAISDQDLEFSEPREGKINISTKHAGLLKINVDALLQVNKMENIIVATLKNNFPCKKGEIIAGTRIIPLTIPTENIEVLETLTKKTGTLLSVKPYKSLKIGAVVTGSEVFNGLITDDFGPSVGKKITDAGCTLIKKIIVPDEEKAISNAILELKKLGCEMIITTGGLSVDPDDVTRQGVIRTGADVTFYGSPVLPGAMLMVSRLADIPIISLPACVFYYKQTVFDLIFPRVLAGEIITEDDIAAMGHGGLCMNCKVCHYPVCSFGR